MGLVTSVLANTNGFNEEDMPELSLRLPFNGSTPTITTAASTASMIEIVTKDDIKYEITQESPVVKAHTIDISESFDFQNQIKKQRTTTAATITTTTTVMKKNSLSLNKPTEMDVDMDSICDDFDIPSILSLRSKLINKLSPKDEDTSVKDRNKNKCTCMAPKSQSQPQRSTQSQLQTKIKKTEKERISKSVARDKLWVETVEFMIMQSIMRGGNHQLLMELCESHQVQIGAM